jgi:hypothetical protein
MHASTWSLSIAAVLLLSAIAPAHAQGRDQGANTYALVVGSNPGGAKQETLRYAEADATRVAEVLRELGGYDAERVHLVLHPDADALLASLDALATQIEADAARGDRSVLFFYYSGHARANALNLGPAELDLARLRQRLLSVPTTLTIVVLDACQSGAFSRIKGAAPSADFSFNSVSRLNAEGVAVMASSSGTELSQESEQLGSSYFTHYLLVALRGAGDGNRDGRVSLDEAYRYAYQETLASTAKTAVGSQHVTLETDLKGKGEIALTFPAEADAHLELPAALLGDILIRLHPSGAVVADLHKSAGEPVRLAFPTGQYRILVRTDKRLLECSTALAKRAAVTLDVSSCSPARVEVSTTKLGAPAIDNAIADWALELSTGLTGRIEDRFTQRLTDFGFNDQDFLIPVYSLALVRRLSDDIQLVGDLSLLDSGSYHRDNDSVDQDFSWRSYGLGVHLRAARPMDKRWLIPFAQAGVGLGRASTIFVDTTDAHDNEIHWGYFLAATAGVNLMPWKYFGVSLRASYRYAPIVDNLIEDSHDSGGLYTSIGLRAAF